MIWDIENGQQRKYVPYVRVVLLDGSDLRDVMRVDTTTGEVTRLKRNDQGSSYVQHDDDCAAQITSCFNLKGRTHCATATETIICPGVRVEPKVSAPELIKQEWPR